MYLLVKIVTHITRVVNGDESLTFDDAVQRMKSIYEQKVKWLDEAIKKM